MSNTVIKSNSVQSIISSVLVTSLMGVFIIAFITSTFLSYRSQQQQVNADKKKIHALMDGLIAPSLALSDTTEIQRLLSLVSTPDEFFGVVNNENNILLSDYSKIKVVKSALLFDSKMASCNEIQDNVVSLDGRSYTLHCTTLQSPDVEYGSNKAHQKIGMLVSFSYYQPLVISSQLFHILLWLPLSLHYLLL